MNTPVGLCGNRADHEPHYVEVSSLGPYFCSAKQEDREPERSERRRREARRQLEA